MTTMAPTAPKASGLLAAPPAVEPVRLHGPDETLVAALRQGDMGASTELFERFAARVERVIARIVGVDSELLDLVHETFVHALARTHQLRDARALPEWITRIAVNTATDCLRRRQRRRRWFSFFVTGDADDEAPWPVEVDLDGLEALRATHRILGRLPVDERVAFVLRFVDGLPLAEVAASCGCSLATVKRRLARAEARFRGLAQQHPALADRVRRSAGGDR